MFHVENMFQKWLADLLARQGYQYKNVALARIYEVLSRKYNFNPECHKILWNKEVYEHLIVLSEYIIHISTQLETFNDNIRKNKTYDTESTGGYCFIFVKNNDDLNFLRLILGREDRIEIDLRPLNKHIDFYNPT